MTPDSIEYYGTKRVRAWPEHKDVGERSYVGYAVRYPDGYLSWCPAAAFEEAYQPLDALSFGHALHAMRNGSRVRRAGWKDEDVFIYGTEVPLRFPFSSRKTTKFQLIEHREGLHRVWDCSDQEDLLADDWQIVGK